MPTDASAQEPVDPPEHDGIVVSDLAFRYQGTAEPAISDITFDVPPGHGLCISGGEGSGKTTIIRALVGLVTPNRGQVRVARMNPLDPAARRHIGYAPERMPFPYGLRVIDAVREVAAIRGVAAAADEVLERVGLPAGDRRLITSLELGDVRRASLACALVGDPPILVLDDPWEFPETVAVLTAALADGRTVVAASPDPGGLPALLGAHLDLGNGTPE